jgi:hypothetical protein
MCGGDVPQTGAAKDERIVLPLVGLGRLSLKAKRSEPFPYLFYSDTYVILIHN